MNLSHWQSWQEPGQALPLQQVSHLTSGIFFYFIFFFGLFRATPMAYGGSQARGQIGPVATSLRRSNSNAGSEPRLQPTPQLTATPDP